MSVKGYAAHDDGPQAFLLLPADFEQRVSMLSTKVQSMDCAKQKERTGEFKKKVKEESRRRAIG